MVLDCISKQNKLLNVREPCEAREGEPLRLKEGNPEVREGDPA